MMLSYLYTLPSLKSALFDGSGRFPDIPTIQEVIELAWQAGFDSGGAAQLGYSVRGTRKWIGTSEIASVLSYFGLRVAIYEFKSIPNTPSQKGQPTYKPNTELINWVYNYFSQTNDNQFLPPLYLQYSGHSKTIVGVERASNDTIYLLIFDTSQNGQKLLANANKPHVGILKFAAYHFVKKEYQIVTVKNPALLSDTQWENAKILKIDSK